jgi:hypothetical protein
MQFGDTASKAKPVPHSPVWFAQQTSFDHERSEWGWVGAAAIRLRQQATTRRLSTQPPLLLGLFLIPVEDQTGQARVSSQSGEKSPSLRRGKIHKASCLPQLQFSKLA